MIIVFWGTTQVKHQYIPMEQILCVGTKSIDIDWVENEGGGKYLW